MDILIKNGRILDPSLQKDEIGDLYIKDGKIQKAEKGLETKADRVIDADGCFVMPGLIDIHVHLRDPGQEYKETIESGSAAAAKGGFTTIVAMPNTVPVIDNKDRVSYVKNKAEMVSPIHVIQSGAITVGQKDQEITDIEGMVQAGAGALSEDGKSVMNMKIYREAMKEAARLNVPVLAHCEDKSLAGGGCMNEDEKAKELNLPGICNATEDAIIARDIILAHDTGARLHLCHCSTKGSVEILRQAKQAGYDVTGEVCPHHFTLTTDDISTDNPNYKMNPPLRSEEDKKALIEGLKDGTMDVISTDHAPHGAKEKQGSMRNAAFGIVGLETSVALTMTELVEKGILTPLQMAEKMSYNPAKVLGISKGTLQEGADADVTIIDPKASYKIDKGTFVSKGRNTPFDGKKVKGRVIFTICDGNIVYEYK
ncbi:dihydroorotase [Blautia sp. An249]|uniref:dihydroorotase n=1 Tax=Blautia sp. An249 TaxID=1965603 RepID=UPI000B3A971D|nr:dihydroorotase [Blautia sp. An249]OUO77750.1 dihydroorotase [Blautia sp. An249]